MKDEEDDMTDTKTKVFKNDSEWRAQLTPEQFEITRRHGTERPFTGPHLNEKKAGRYACVCCGAELFDAEAKFDSGTGWPSYFQPVDGTAISEHSDNGFFMRRTEVRCAKCDAHLGHVFPDGPRPTGLRYCINGTAMTFAPRDGSKT